VMGCSEFQVAGKFNTGNGGLCHVNVLKMLELALYGGTNPFTGQCLCPGEGDLSTFRSFEEVLAAFRHQLRYYLGLVPILDGITCRTYEELTPTPFLSALLDSRLETGQDVSKGGGPNYRNLQSLAQGITNVADSLAAIKKFVFEDKRLTGAELLGVLRADFQGPRGEEIRQLLLNRAPSTATTTMPSTGWRPRFSASTPTRSPGTPHPGAATMGRASSRSRPTCPRATGSGPPPMAGAHGRPWPTMPPPRPAQTRKAPRPC